MYVISPDVPKTTYQTPIDKFILVTISLLAATAIHAVLLSELVPQVSGVQYTTHHTPRTVLTIHHIHHTPYSPYTTHCTP
jgi:hypothetical protein